MKDIELSYIDINGVSYPLYCDLNVLELIQEKFTSINSFERDLLGLTPLKTSDGQLQRDENGSILNMQGEPKIKAIVYGLFLMVKEGQRIEARQTGKEQPELTIDEIREACSVPFNELAVILHDAFNRCFNIKKKSNETTQKRIRKRNIRKSTSNTSI